MYSPPFTTLHPSPQPQLKKLADKLGPPTTELQRFLDQVAGTAEFQPPLSGVWNISETVKSATFSPLPPPARATTEQLRQILGTEALGISNLTVQLAASVCSEKQNFLKGTVPGDFLPLVFFFKQLLLAPVDKPSNDFDFFRIFAETFDYSGRDNYSRRRRKLPFFDDA
jgi:hypothetical protein